MPQMPQTPPTFSKALIYKGGERVAYRKVASVAYVAYVAYVASVAYKKKERTHGRKKKMRAMMGLTV